MPINLDLYQVFMIATISLGAFFGLAKLIAKQALESINEKLGAFKEIKDAIKELTQSVNNTELDLLKIKLDIAHAYIAFDSHAKLMALALLVQTESIAMSLSNAVLGWRTTKAEQTLG